MIFYHRTTEKSWRLIQQEGVLWGILKHCKTYPRYTYLAPFDIGDNYGTVLLAVNYEPRIDDFGVKHNYGFYPPEGLICDQFSVFEAIPISNVKRIAPADAGITPQIYIF